MMTFLREGILFLEYMYISEIKIKYSAFNSPFGLLREEKMLTFLRAICQIF